MQPIPEPQLLDPDRVTSDDREDMTSEEHRSRAQQLDKALHETCAYAKELWQHLDATRHYLWESLPSDPHAPGPDPHLGASPTGPGDEEGWRRWIDAFAAVTSILAGPHGDSGYGAGEARLAARARREAPNLRVLERIERGKSETQPPTPATPASTPTPDTPTPARRDTLRLAGLALLGALALRGMLPRRTTR